MPQRLLFLDFETYFDTEYSLSKMPTPNYVLDDRFEMQICAVAEDMGPSRIIDGPDFPAFISQYDPAETTTVTFNALFDNSILAWRYGFVPHMMLDAMSMARILLGHELDRFSLGKVSEHLGLGSKGDALVKVKGLRRSQIMQDGTLLANFRGYALQDNNLSRAIFFKLIDQLPMAERRIMDLVIRCAVEPKFNVDVDMLRAHIQDVKDAKSAMLAVSGATVDQLMSAAEFMALLQGLNVPIQYKQSPSNPAKNIPALAKTDDFMAELLEHPDWRVQALATARLGHKSTIEETRCEKFLSIATLPGWTHYRDGNPRLGSGGVLPMPLKFGPHTHRLAGDWGMNVQNMPTQRGSKGKSKLRQALVAAPGHSVIKADLGQIECRLSAWICGAVNLLQEFRDKKDPYALLATEIFGFVVIRKVHILEGFIGKTGILGLGYGAGAEKFDSMVTTMARAADIDLTGRWTSELAQDSVTAYRKRYHAIPKGWRRLDNILKTAWLGKSGPCQFGPVVISKGKVTGPAGADGKSLCLNYKDPSEDSNGELWYKFGRFRHKIYGAKLLENIIQFLARIVVMNAALRLDAKGIRFRLQAHDELVFIVPNDTLDAAKQIIHSEMVRPPSWAPDLPLTADVLSGPNYGECA